MASLKNRNLFSSCFEWPDDNATKLINPNNIDKSSIYDLIIGVILRGIISYSFLTESMY